MPKRIWSFATLHVFGENTNHGGRSFETLHVFGGDNNHGGRNANVEM